MPLDRPVLFIRVPAPLQQAVKAAADAEQLTVAQYVREVLREHLRAQGRS